MDTSPECHVEPFEKITSEEDLLESTTAYLSVSGMGCPRCAMRVQNGLLQKEGVFYAEVFLEQGIASVAYNQEAIGPRSLEQAVTAAGNDGKHHYQAKFINEVPTRKLRKLQS
ncbi:MAG: heavy-metal-associated domain-containing protein [Chloroflexi bacterium]|nr:MAG: heavy-metal-associated domain-containing protein [Chloroflexota bacterium]MBL1194955.1 heavy-metal-associated domain-containing protein [Chloroflexota bacterium]NOH12245.1 heavy-metal-associated domain-containing protein [Chloroflexota bacterium]